jgi:hypothetical protein
MGVAGSNPVAPTIKKARYAENAYRAFFKIFATYPFN